MLGCIRTMRKALWLLRDIDRKVDHLMTQQDEINQYAQDINAAVTGLAADFEAYASAHPDLDLSPLRPAVDRLKALDAERPAVEPEPAPEPTPEG